MLMATPCHIAAYRSRFVQGTSFTPPAPVAACLGRDSSGSGPPPDGHHVAGAPLAERIELDVVSGGLDDAVAAHVEGGVVDAGPVGLDVSPEDQIAGLEAAHRHRCAGRVVLVVGHPGETYAVGMAPRCQRQSRAVEALGAV